MFKEESVMNDKIRTIIRLHCRDARTKGELVAALLASFDRSQIDWRTVSLEDMKTAVVIAHHAVRDERGERSLSLLA